MEHGKRLYTVGKQDGREWKERTHKQYELRSNDWVLQATKWEDDGYRKAQECGGTMKGDEKKTWTRERWGEENKEKKKTPQAVLTQALHGPGLDSEQKCSGKETVAGKGV